MSEQPKTKVCSKCERELPAEYFGKNTTTKSGLQSYCKDCQKEAVRRRRESLLISERLYMLPDTELIAELRKRGYIGKIHKKIEVVL